MPGCVVWLSLLTRARYRWVARVHALQYQCGWSRGSIILAREGDWAERIAFLVIFCGEGSGRAVDEGAGGAQVRVGVQGVYVEGSYDSKVRIEKGRVGKLVGGGLV